MKGITPVIATILLLLIAVAIVGIAFTFFSRITQGATENVEQQTTQQLTQMQKTISIDALNLTTVVVRSTSSIAIPVTDLKVYVNNAQVTCTNTAVWTGNLAAGSTIRCDFGNQCTTGLGVRVVSPAMAVTDTCP